MRTNYELTEEDYSTRVSDNYEDGETFWGDAWWDLNEDIYQEDLKYNYERN